MTLSANWKTTVSGIGAALVSALTILAALPYDLGTLSTILPPAWKPKIVAIGIVAAFLLKVWNSIAQKSKEVTGGSVAQTLDGSVAKPGTQTLVDITKATTDASNGKPQPPPKTI